MTPEQWRLKMSKKGECKHLECIARDISKYCTEQCKLGHPIVNDDTCVDCEDYEEVE